MPMQAEPWNASTPRSILAASPCRARSVAAQPTRRAKEIRWFTFRSTSPYGRSLALTMAVYTILLIISTFSQAILADRMGFDHLAVWALNTAAFGFLSFIALRFIAFPMSDGTISVRERMEIAKLGRRS